MAQEVSNKEKNSLAELPDEEYEARQKYAMAFAKAMAQQTIHDPAGKTSRRASRTYTTYTRENIEGWLEAPTTNEKNLREASIFLYQTNSRYRNLLQYYSNVPLWLYTITPVNYNPEKSKRDTFKKQYQKACNIIESMNIVKTMREAALIALREGVLYGVIWGGDGSSFILQRLNPDDCQIVSIGDGGVFQFTYDMSKIKEADLPAYYPPQFTDMFNEYRRTGNQYQVVPPEISFCLKGDPTIVEYSIPPPKATVAPREMGNKMPQAHSYSWCRGCMERKTSSFSISIICPISKTLAQRLRCDSMTPFGVSVVPAV